MTSIKLQQVSASRCHPTGGFFLEQRATTEELKKPTRFHLLFYCTSYNLNMFRALLCPSSGPRDYVVDYHIGRFVLDLL